MAAKKASKGTSRGRKGGARGALKDLPPGARKAKSVKGGLLPAIKGTHNYDSLSNLIAQKVQKVNPTS